MKRAIVYLRVSTDEQAESGLGLEAQAHACTRWVEKEGQGRLLVGPFADDGVSGAVELDRRPALVEALGAIEPGDMLLVAKRDRLSRDSFSIAMIEAAVKKKKGRIVSAAGEGTESDDPGSILMRRMIDAFAEYERLLIKSRTKAALAAKSRRGERVGTVPYGHDLAGDGKTLLVNEHEQGAIRLMKGLHFTGQTTRAIAAALDAAGYRTKSGKGHWHHASVAQILKRTS